MINTRDVADEERETFWIPGDWGNITNESNSGQLGREGENIIYLGWTTDSESKVQNTARFWGHPLGVNTLDEIKTSLRVSCGSDINPQVNTIRRDINHDAFAGSSN